MTLGEKIHELRIQKNMTLEELGSELGVGRAAVNKYEKGIVENLKLSSILKLCNIFEITPTNLLLDNLELAPLDEEKECVISIYRKADKRAQIDALDILKKHRIK